MRFQLLVLTTLGCIFGCTPKLKPAASTRAHAQCLVCQYDNDLACVDVSVEANTPSTVYQGKSYYFCSDHCRIEFAKSPEKYLKQ